MADVGGGQDLQYDFSIALEGGVARGESGEVNRG